MFSRSARAFAATVFTPVARFLLSLGISPDAVTLVGTVGVSASALVFFPRGDFLVGTLAICAFVFSDTVDGTMARLSGRVSTFGAFWDSTLDRISDAAIFVGLLMWFAGAGDSGVLAWVCAVVLVGSSLTSYTRAKAESLGFNASVGVAERTERTVLILLATGLDGLGVPYVLAAALWVLAVATWVTVTQRIMAVRRQAPRLTGTP
jgi:phosphatidylglycerophosphate synthase